MAIARPSLAYRLNSRVLLPAESNADSQAGRFGGVAGRGIMLVFTGLSAALGFTVIGILASVAAIAALLYAGAVWFGEAPVTPIPAGADETLIVFDRSLRVAAGGAPGVSVLARFPELLRPEIEATLPRGASRRTFALSTATTPAHASRSTSLRCRSTGSSCTASSSAAPSFRWRRWPPFRCRPSREQEIS